MHINTVILRVVDSLVVGWLSDAMVTVDVIVLLSVVIDVDAVPVVIVGTSVVGIT